MQSRNPSQESFVQNQADAQIVTRYTFDLATIKSEYKANHSTWIREAANWRSVFMGHYFHY